MKVLAPGSTLGVLGTGQLGRMFAMAAERLGYKVIGFGPEHDSPLSQVCAAVHCAAFDDKPALSAFAEQVDAITIEFENIPSMTLDFVAQFKPANPSTQALHTCQNRLREKEFLSSNNFPVAPYMVLTPDAESKIDVAHAMEKIGLPAVFKTLGFGYDGKGQQIVSKAAEAQAALETLFAFDGWKHAGVIVESFISFQKEISVIGARSHEGQFAAYGPIENTHKNHILDVSVMPARVSQQIAAQAVSMTQSIMEQLDVVGLLCVEFFLTADDQLLVNELAPRPHNSGHLTIEACATSQFEQLVRIMTGLPLGDTQLNNRATATAMANLLGDLWTGGEPHWSAAAGMLDVRLHLYGKTDARPGRKMGHITASADSVDQAIAKVTRARELMTRTSNKSSVSLSS